jgi:hypothetical protein
VQLKADIMEFGGPVPTFDDLSIDDNMSQLDRVVKYSTSTIALQRLVHVKVSLRCYHIVPGASRFLLLIHRSDAYSITFLLSLRCWVRLLPV